MKKVIIILVIFACAVGGVFAWRTMNERGPAVNYRTATIVKSNIMQTIEATGTIQPIKEVEVGTQVNGRVIELLADFNTVVKEGQVVARIDPQVYEASYAQNMAQLKSNQANVKRMTAQLILAEKTLKRQEQLASKGMTAVANLDAAISDRDALIAQLDAAKASVEQSEANVKQSKANLDYCTIISPVSGIVIKRSVDEGQTVVSSMNAVSLFNIATDLKRIQVEASVPEADVGTIKVGQTVTFTVDAYRRKFTGTVKQIRLSATTTNNVVTYPIIIEADNPDEQLFPGMTATISVEIARADNVLIVTSAAFRYTPENSETDISGRKVWVIDANGKPEAVAVTAGISDGSFTEIKAPLSLEGREVILGVAAMKQKTDDTKNPFMPTPPARKSGGGSHR